MSARDKDTGAEQRITISESSNLDKSEVERMVADAEANRAEDRQLRELTDARNELDSAAYQVERRLSELGQAVPVHEKARAETLVADARQAIADQTPAGQLRSLTSELQQVYHGLGASGSGSSGPGPGGAGPSGQGPSGQGSPGQSPGDDDVIDAEFTTP